MQGDETDLHVQICVCEAVDQLVTSCNHSSSLLTIHDSPVQKARVTIVPPTFVFNSRVQSRVEESTISHQCQDHLTSETIRELLYWRISTMQDVISSWYHATIRAREKQSPRDVWMCDTICGGLCNNKLPIPTGVSSPSFPVSNQVVRETRKHILWLQSAFVATRKMLFLLIFRDELPCAAEPVSWSHNASIYCVLKRICLSFITEG